MLFKESLEDLSFEVLQATDGKEALLILEKNQVDCIVTDITMPNMTGPEFIKILQEERASVTPVFFITGYTDYPRNELNALKPRAIIFKPFDFEEAALLIKEHILRLG